MIPISLAFFSYSSHAEESGRAISRPGRCRRVAPSPQCLGGYLRRQSGAARPGDPMWKRCWSIGSAPRAIISSFPIDECYKLVGLIRLHWRGLSGGAVVWGEIGRFFDELRQREMNARANV